MEEHVSLDSPLRSACIALPPALVATIGIRFKTASLTLTSKPSRVLSCNATVAPCMSPPNSVSEGGARTIETSLVTSLYSSELTICRQSPLRPNFSDAVTNL